MTVRNTAFGFQLAVMAFALACLVIMASAALSPVHWLFDFAGQFLLPATYLLFASGAALIAIWLAVPQHRSALVAAVICILASAGVLFGLTPPHPAVPEGDTALRLSVYQHNVWIRSRAFEEEVAAIRASDADIIALVEAWPSFYEEITEELSDTWPYSAAGTHPPATYTRLRLLSKYPIESAQMRFPERSPAILQAELSTPAGPLNVILVHFTRPWPFDAPDAQVVQLDGLEPWIEGSSGPTVLLGDFNSAAWGRLSRRLQSKFGLQIANDPRVGTWPAKIAPGRSTRGLHWPDWAGIPIDLAFCGGGAVCLGHKVAQSTGSDHFSTRFEVVMDGQDR